MLSLRRISGSSPHARGAPYFCSCYSCNARDHPRMRGEHVDGLADDARAGGIIPACAGSTWLRPSCSLSSRGSSPHARGARSRLPCHRRRCTDHPRMRGEHASRWTSVSALPGSSPHARGARRESSRPCQSCRDHPRMRGEHGSEFDLRSAQEGIIPACAGSTSAAFWLSITFAGSSPHARGGLGR